MRIKLIVNMNDMFLHIIKVHSKTVSYIKSIN